MRLTLPEKEDVTLPRNPVVILDEIVTELQYLEEAVERKDWEDFIEDRTLQKALERSLEILGEAVKALPLEIQSRHPDIPWSDMARNRDLLIHAYHRVEPAIVWRTVTEHAVPLRPLMEDVLDKEKNGPHKTK